MDIFNALIGQTLGTSGIFGLSQAALSDQEMAQRMAQQNYSLANQKPNPAFEMLMAQYKEAMWVPPGWLYWFEIGDELH